MERSPTLDLAPAIIVIFGITGDLSTRKLLPSLYELEKSGLLHQKTRIIGISRREVDKNMLLEQTKASVRAADKQVDQKSIDKLARRLTIYQMSAADPKDYPGLAKHLNLLEDKAGVCLHMLYYLAIPPQIAGPVISNLGQNGMNIGCKRHQALAHLLLEKPFGFDTSTAQQLIADSKKYFEEQQIFYIDHYLAKETVQNLVTFRFRNPIFEDIWSNKNIATIEIVADEQLDIEGRANFYEQVGAMRDLVQSHLLHILSVILMARPADISDSVEVHNKRLAAMQNIESVPADKILTRVIRAQYDGYRHEAENPRSNVETFVAIKLYSNDPLWSNVPIYLRTGKALAGKQTCVRVHFRPQSTDHNHTNVLTFYIQPQESIGIGLWVKKPGFDRVLQTAPMRFSYQQSFGSGAHPDAYERVLVDAIRGDNTLFATSEEILEAWRVLQPVLDYWSKSSKDLVTYGKGTNGPSTERLY